MTNQKGFSLIEILVTTAIIVLISTFMIFNFRGGTIGSKLTQAARQVSADIRRAQNTAASGIRFGGVKRCGYGVDYVDSITFRIYAGADATVDGACDPLDRNFDAGDAEFERITLLHNNEIEFAEPWIFNEIFFEPPDPRTYINNVFNLSGSDATIRIRLRGVDCNQTPENCRTVRISPSGTVGIDD